MSSRIDGSIALEPVTCQVCGAPADTTLLEPYDVYDGLGAYLETRYMCSNAFACTLRAEALR